MEAIARLQWTTPVPWNFTTPGVLFEHLRATYPEEPKAQARIRVDVLPPDLSATGEATNTGLQFTTGPERILFSQKGGTRLLGVSAIDVSVHGLSPYEGWESLEARLIEATEIVRPLLDDDATISMMSVRYINHVELPAGPVSIDDFLTISIGFPPGYPPNITAFLDRVEMEYPEDRAKLAFTWASTEAPEGHVAFILDLDLHVPSPEPLSLSEAIDTLRELKAKERQAFEGLLRDKLREQFGEIID